MKLDITPVLEHYGVKVPQRETGWITVRCPFGEHSHGDRNPSGRATLEDGGAFFCNACGIKGNALGLIMQVEGLDVSGAQRFYTETLGGSGIAVREESPRKRRKPLSGESGDWERGSELLPTRSRRKPRAGG